MCSYPKYLKTRNSWIDSQNVYDSDCHLLKGDRTCAGSITVCLAVFAIRLLMDLSDPVRHLDSNWDVRQSGACADGSLNCYLLWLLEHFALPSINLFYMLSEGATWSQCARTAIMGLWQLLYCGFVSSCYKGNECAHALKQNLLKKRKYIVYMSI